MSVAQQRALIAQANPASSVVARCQALGLSPSSFYYRPCGESAYVILGDYVYQMADSL